jgi:hypothetical protein
MPASPADIDVFEIRKLQQYMRGYNSSLVQSDLRRIGLLLMYNRYYFLAIFLFLTGSTHAKNISILASLLSFSFLFWTSILASESGREANIASRNAGYYLWLCSLVILTTCIAYCNKIKNDK